MHMQKVVTTACFAFAAAIFLSANALAEDTPPPTPSAQAAPSKEVREKMAALHEKMAACLRSDKTIDACRTEMRASCYQTVGAQTCPMIGMGGGMGRGRAMPSPPVSPSK